MPSIEPYKPAQKTRSLKKTAILTALAGGLALLFFQQAEPENVPPAAPAPPPAQPVAKTAPAQLPPVLFNEARNIKHLGLRLVVMPGGHVMTGIMPGGPAYVAGIPPRSVIREINGKNPWGETIDRVEKMLAGPAPIRLKITNGQKGLTLNITLTPDPSAPFDADRLIETPSLGATFTAETLAVQMAPYPKKAYLPQIGANVYGDEKALIIGESFSGSPVQYAGLEPGDIVRDIDGASLEGLPFEAAAAKLAGMAGTSSIILADRPLANGETGRVKATLPRMEKKYGRQGGMTPAPRLP